MSESTGPEIAMPYGDDAISNGSGKDWAEWKRLLDDWGAPDKPHAEIARHVAAAYGVSDWWAQGVTVGYERMIGRRAVGERSDGSFSASASKTMRHGIDAHFAAWHDEARRNGWLPLGTLTLRTARPQKSLRFDDNENGGIVALTFEDKGNGKSSVSVQMDNLPTKADVNERKLVWKDRLVTLSQWLDETDH